MKQFSSIILIAWLFGIGCIKDPVTTSEDTLKQIKYSFFVAGHTYGTPGVNNVGLHPPFVDKFDYIIDDPLIEFGVLTGDFVIVGSEQNFNEVDSQITQLGIPVYYTPGYHDMNDRELWESRYGLSYQSFLYKEDLILILDPTIDLWNISDAQLDFLRKAIFKHAGKINNIFIFFHQVLWWSLNNEYNSIALNSLAGRADSINFWVEVAPLFHDLPHHVVMFAGDVGAFSSGHEYTYHNQDNITFIASGMGSGTRDNFIVTDVYDDGSIGYRLIALNFGDDIDALGELEDYMTK